MSRQEFTLDHLIAFVKVAQLKHFGKAAEALGRSQPRITQRVQQLEQLLGTPGRPVRLLDRTPRGAVLTSRGLDVFELALGLTQDWERFLQVARGGKGPFTRLRLGVSDTIAQTWLPGFIQRLREVYPLLDLEVEVDISPQLGQRLLREELDLAFLLRPPTEPAVVSRLLSGYPMSFIARPGLLPGDAPVSLRALAELPILTFSRNTQPYLDVLRLMRQPGLPRAQIYACASLAPVVRMAREGVGVAVIPDAVVRDELSQGLLQRLKTEARVNKLVFCASWLALGNASTRSEMTRITDIARSCARAFTMRPDRDSAGRSRASLQAHV